MKQQSASYANNVFYMIKSRERCLLCNRKDESERLDIRKFFSDFYERFSCIETDQLLDYFACFGGAGRQIEIDCFENLDESVLRIFVEEFPETEKCIEPRYILDSPYREILISTARGDGKIFNIFRRAGIHETAGGRVVSELEESGVLKVENSREMPLRTSTRQYIKKEYRGYRIQPKIRFVRPFYRFWFGFAEPYRKELYRAGGGSFMQNYRLHRDRAVSLVFEQLSNELLVLFFSKTDPVVSMGGFWDKKNEFDLMCRTQSGKIILGECKYKSRKICRNELGKLKEKAERSGLNADYYALFSRRGFSRELIESTESDLLLFSIEDFLHLLR